MNDKANRTGRVSRREALILFSRLPVGIEVKTRLSPEFSEEEREEVQKCFWKDVFPVARSLEGRADVFLYWTGSGTPVFWAELIPDSFFQRPQGPGGLGERMARAFSEVFGMGYEAVLLMGTDIPQVSPESLNRAFDVLSEADVVLGPTRDGGYWIVGLKKPELGIFELNARWGGEDVFRATAERALELGLILGEAPSYRDVDTLEDALALLEEESFAAPATRACLASLLKKR